MVVVTPCCRPLLWACGPAPTSTGPRDPCECWPPGVAAVGASLQGEAQAPRASRSLGPCLGDPQRVLKSLSQRHRGGRACVLPSLLLNCAAVRALRAGVRGHSTACPRWYE